MSFFPQLDNNKEIDNNIKQSLREGRTVPLHGICFAGAVIILKMKILNDSAIILVALQRADSACGPVWQQLPPVQQKDTEL